MQKVKEDVTRIHTRGATFPEETKRVIQNLSGEVINVIIMVFSIIDDKKFLNIFFMKNPNEILSFKRDCFEYQVVEFYFPNKPEKGVKGVEAENFFYYVGK